MRQDVKQIRKLIKHIDGAWVRKLNERDDYSFWVGCKFKCDIKLIIDILTENGYQCDMTGAPGTSGANIIDVKEPQT